jgi:hypothetical protein
MRSIFRPSRQRQARLVEQRETRQAEELEAVRDRHEATVGSVVTGPRLDPAQLALEIDVGEHLASPGVRRQRDVVVAIPCDQPAVAIGELPRRCQATELGRSLVQRHLMPGISELEGQAATEHAATHDAPTGHVYSC